jgi:Fur family ferric uptake transcriptional regulator
MSSYNTPQKERILSYLCLHINEDLTVHEIIEGVRNELPNDIPIAESTVYRIMNNLTQLGLTCKKTDSNREFRYRLCKNDNNNSRISFHCKVCGKIYHIDETVCNSIIKELHENCPVRTDEELLLTGVCDNCQQR